MSSNKLSPDKFRTLEGKRKDDEMELGIEKENCLSLSPPFEGWGPKFSPSLESAAIDEEKSEGGGKAKNVCNVNLIFVGIPFAFLSR